MSERLCKYCNEYKNYPGDFSSGYQCKKCRLIKTLEWTKNNPDKRKKAVNKYHESHKEQEKLYKINNKEKILQKNKIYEENNRDKINARINRRRKENPNVSLHHTISCLIRHNLNGTKCGSILNHLPYTMEELKIHIETYFKLPENFWMNWNNRGLFNPKTWKDDDPSTWKWQLDHIIPQSKLPYTSMEDENFKICWSLDNLRPLSAKQNILDGNRR